MSKRLTRKLLPMLMAGLGLVAACGTTTSTPTPVPPSPQAVVVSTPAPTAPPPTAAPATAAPTAAPTVGAYDLGAAVLEQANITNSRRNLPYRLQGVIAVPAGAGPFPLVIIAHGSHPACPIKNDGGDLQVDSWPCAPEQEQRNDLGWRYLAEALAAQGYVAVAPNLNAVHTQAWGTFGSTFERFKGLLDANLLRLAAASAGEDVGLGVDLRGKIDFARTALIGHSQGGGYAMVYTDDRLRNPGADAALRSPLAAALLVAPYYAGTRDEDGPATVPPADLPVGMVLGLCDGDVAGLQGFSYYEPARAAAGRASPMQITLLSGANHNGFNPALAAEDGLGATAPNCVAPAGRIDAADQRAFLVAYAREFLAATFDGAAPGPAWQPGDPAPAELFGQRVQTALLAPSAEREALLALDGETLAGPAGGSVTATEPLSATLCSLDEGAACNAGQYGVPAAAQSKLRLALLTWSTPGGALRVELPKDMRDLSGLTALQLRLALNGLDPSNAAGQALSVVLRDASGAEARVTLGKELAALQPPQTVLKDPDLVPYLAGDAPLTVARVPLSAFTGVDLSQIVAVELVFDQTDAGSILLSDLELLR